MIKLVDASKGDRIRFVGRRKVFTVRSQNHIVMEIREGKLSDYPDGRNFDEFRGTMIKSSSGRLFITKSDRLVEIVG